MNNYIKTGSKIMRVIQRIKTNQRRKFVLNYVIKEDENPMTRFFLGKYLARQLPNLDATETACVIKHFQLFIDDVAAGMTPDSDLARYYGEAHAYMGLLTTEKEAHFRIAAAYNNQEGLIKYAEVLEEKGRLTQALKMWEIALTVCEDEKDDVGFILNRIGCVYDILENGEKAREYFDRAVATGNEESKGNVRLYASPQERESSSSDKEAAEILVDISANKRSSEEEERAPKRLKITEGGAVVVHPLSRDDVVELIGERFLEEIVRRSAAGREQHRQKTIQNMVRQGKKLIYDAAGHGNYDITLKHIVKPTLAEWTVDELASIAEAFKIDDTMRVFAVASTVTAEKLTFDIEWKK